MGNQFKTALSLAICTLALASCGGSSVSDSASSGGSSVTPGGPPSSATGDGVSYLPLTVYEAYKEFSGFQSDGLFQIDGQYPYIDAYLINPVSSSNLLPVTTATASNYSLKVDDIEIDSFESFPKLQKLIGAPTLLSTALVFDVSGSVNEVDIQALVAEAKAYVAQAQSHPNETISSQRFVVWAFATDIADLTGGFTTVTTDINNALDQVVTIFNANSLGSSSNLHKAILQSVGRYVDTANGYDFISDGDNDLYDWVGLNGTFLSQLVLFSSGPDTALEIDQELMRKAVESQAFVKYVAASSSETRFLEKPVFYYVMGSSTPGNTYQPLADISESVESLTLSGGAYSFASGLITQQISAMTERVDVNNQYVYRYAFQPRLGDHTVVFDSSSTEFAYSLTSEYKEAGLDPSIGSPAQELSSLVEITGPSGEFISGYVPQNTTDYVGTIKLSEENTFAPATRWVNDIYDPVSDYTWSISGGTGTVNGNGSYTVNSIGGAIATLTLTNILRNESSQIIISNQ
ncbi:MAG: hypothetical protein ACRBCS_10655 [Cellvibrionaceae bacterium]